MSTQPSTKPTQEPDRRKRRLPNGSVCEFLVSPAEARAEVCLIRFMIPPGAASPLHSHPDVEIFYILEGSLETFQSRGGTSGWTTLGPGDFVSIPGNIKHAVRNSSPFPATLVCVTAPKLYEFFQEVAKLLIRIDRPLHQHPMRSRRSTKLAPDSDIGRARPRRIEPSASE